MKYCITLIFLFFGLGVFSQNFSNYQNITLQTATDYRKVEPQVMLAYELVLSTPVDKKTPIGSMPFPLLCAGCRAHRIIPL